MYIVEEKFKEAKDGENNSAKEIEMKKKYPELQDIDDRIQALEGIEAPQANALDNPLQELVNPTTLPAAPAKPQEIHESISNITDGDEFKNQDRAAQEIQMSPINKAPSKT